jgi:Xaa-Pro dipeptidase
VTNHCSYFNEFGLQFYLNDSKKSKYIDEKVLKKYMPVGGVRIEDDILVRARVSFERC